MRFIIAAVALALLAVPAHASGPFTVTSTVVLTEDGQDMKLHQGRNHIDTPTQMNCVSAAGCSITFQSTVSVEGNSKNEHMVDWCLRSLVDGVKARPDCKYKTDEFARVVELQTLDVAQGMHTVQTDIECRHTFTDRRWKGKLTAWAIVYTMYDH